MKKLYTFKNGPVFWPTLYIDNSGRAAVYSSNHASLFQLQSKIDRIN